MFSWIIGDGDYDEDSDGEVIRWMMISRISNWPIFSRPLIIYMARASNMKKQLVQRDNDDYIHDDDSDDSGVMKFQTDQLSQECWSFIESEPQIQKQACG